MKITRVYKVIDKRHKNQNWIWKKLHQSKMFVCKHSIEPCEISDYNYYSDIHYGECINCEALCVIENG